MTVMTTIDVHGMTADEYRRVMARLAVDTNPDSGIYLHVTAQTDFGFRVIEIWDSEEHFHTFVERRLGPAAQAENITRQMEMKVEPVHNLLAPRESELSKLAPHLPGGWRGKPS